MTGRYSVKELLEFNPHRQVGEITYFSTFNYNLKELEKQYKQAIAEYFDESAEFLLKTPYFEDAYVIVRVPTDTISAKIDGKPPATGVFIKKAPIGLNAQGNKVYFDLTEKQRNQWLITVYKQLLEHVSANGSREPMQEANEVIKRIGMQLTKPNEKGEVFISEEDRGQTESSENLSVFLHQFGQRQDDATLNIALDGMSNKVSLSEEGLKLTKETKPSFIKRIYQSLKMIFAKLLKLFK